MNKPGFSYNGEEMPPSRLDWLRSLKPGDTVMTTINHGGGPFKPRSVELIAIDFEATHTGSGVGVVLEGKNIQADTLYDSDWIEPVRKPWSSPLQYLPKEVKNEDS